MPRETFISICTRGVASAPSDLMTVEQAKDFLLLLHEARVVIAEEDVVFLRPHEVVQRIHSKLGIAPFVAESLKDSSAAARSTALENSEKALVRTVRWRRRFWSGVALLSAVQMTTLAYLTFVQYDWDVMEPACYFVTMATSIVFYAYFLWYRREHSLRAVDENFLPMKLESELRAADVDVDKLLRSTLADMDGFTRDDDGGLDRWLHSVVKIR
jgi:hypothetical protein